MVWEGIVTGRVTEDTRENIGPAIDSAVAELLADYPAHVAK